MPKLSNIFILDIHLWPASHLAFFGNVKNYKILLTTNYLA